MKRLFTLTLALLCGAMVFAQGVDFQSLTYQEALDGGDPVAKLSQLNGGYDVTFMGWPGDTYATGVADDPATAYDESIGYVVYSYAEYSAMTFAVC